MSESDPSSNSSKPEPKAPQTVVTPEQVVASCPECRGAVDVTPLTPYTKIECPHCNAPFRVRTRLGNYEITGMLGEGGMSQVFLANDVTLNRPVALKILHQTLSLDASLTAMFEREATLMASINHPNVVKVYTASSDQGYFFIAMELVDNISIEQMIAEKGPVPEAEVLDIAHDVTNGLKAAYGEGLIHRDIKPGNMLVTNAGVAKLVDFGLAVVQGGDDEVEDLWATPFYVPPEKLDGKQDTFVGDIYSLGATFFHALAGFPPFEANTSSLDELKEIKKQKVSLAEIAPNVSKYSIEMVEKMMAYDPADRPASYDELLELIESTMDFVPGTTKKRTTRMAEKAEGLKFSDGAMKSLIGGGIALGLGIIALAIVFSGGRGDGNIDDTLITGDDRVIGDEGISAKFIGGRNALVTGDLETAKIAFTALIDSKEVQQPTLGWLHFDQAIIHLLENNEVKAREHFKTLMFESIFPETADETALSQKAFFEKVGSAASGPLPVLEESVSVFSNTTFASLGLLACGLKNWNQGEFESAAVMLDTFAKSPVPKRQAWSAELQPMARKFVGDAAILKTLPRPDGKTSSGDLKDMERTLGEAVAKLNTKGAAPKFVKARLKRCADLEEFRIESRRLAKLANEKRPKSVEGDPTVMPKPVAIGPEGTGVGKFNAPAAKADLATLAAAVESAESLSSAYFFSAAALKIESVTINSTPVRRVHADVLETYKRADAFLDRFVAELSLADYEGAVRRKEGRPLSAKVTNATRENLTVNLGFGENEVEIDKFDPDWIREAAEVVFVNVEKSPLADESDIWEQAAAFALVSGLLENATRLAGIAGDADEEFSKQWTRLSAAGLMGLRSTGAPTKAKDKEKGIFLGDE